MRVRSSTQAPVILRYVGPLGVTLETANYHESTTVHAPRGACADRDRTLASREADRREADEALARLLEQTAEQAEARWRSLTANLLVTAAAAIVAFGPQVPGAASVLGQLTSAGAARVVAAAWCTYELATTAFGLLGPRHKLTVFLCSLDAVGRYVAALALIYLSGSAASPLWIALVINAFVWTAKPPRRAKLELVLPIATALVLALAFLFERRAGDAALAVLGLLVSTAVHAMTARRAARSARVRAERDVIAMGHVAILSQPATPRGGHGMG
jgi:hypothetical protein